MLREKDMLNNRDFIVFSDDWGRHPSSCQHLVTNLLPHNRVLWVNTIGMRSPKLSLYDIGRCFEVVSGWLNKKGVTKDVALPPNLRVVSPIMIPFNNLYPVRAFNRVSTTRKLKELMIGQGMKKPIVVTTFPCTCDLVGEFNESIHVYYCVDDFTNWPGVNKQLISVMEDELIRSCDLILATSDDLCKKKVRANKKPTLLSHGVDFDHFHSALESAKPEEFLAIPSPIIGFFGALSSWLDFDLIVSLAKARPEWSFVFIGPADTDISVLKMLPNIHLVGRVSYERLPAYAAFFDVGIIPFKVNDLTKSVNPLKLLEYLSCGIPVVSSPMPEVARFAHVVTIADGVGDFLAGIEHSLANNEQCARALRKEVARNQSWQAVAERFSDLISVRLSDAVA